MKVFLLAGETSGDMHAAKLMQALKKQRKDIRFSFFGGDRMAAVGGELLLHHREMAFMGFWEVLKNLRSISHNFRLAKQALLRIRPDALILVDFPGFNLRLAEWAKKQGFKIFYYISPQVWAWKESRVKKIKKVVDELFVILPFEKEFYAQHGFEVTYVGHPLLEQFEEENETLPALSPNDKASEEDSCPLVALLPGSRKQEVQRILPVMLQLPLRFPDHRFVIAAAPALSDEFFHGIFRKEKNKLPLIRSNHHALLRQARAAVVCSGTATLETALLGTPQVVGYRGNPLSYLIAKRLVKVPYISLVNLILNRPLVEELIQKAFTADRVEQSLRKLLADPSDILQGYTSLRKLLSPPLPDKSASEIVATRILSKLSAEN